MKNLKRLLLLPALALPLVAGTCTEEKLVDLVIGLPTTAEFIASGELNTHSDSDEVDVKADLDIPGALDDADLDASQLVSIKVVEVHYRITQAEPGRRIENGDLTFQRLTGFTDQGGTPVGTETLVVSGFEADAGSLTDWIDVTEYLQPGINDINDFLAECLAELQGGPPVANTVFRYTVSGDSIDPAIPTNFRWEVKIVIQAIAQEEFEVPFG